MNILIMTPYGLYRRWPTSPDTTKMVTNGAPVTMAQLAAVVPGHSVRIFDGNVYRPPLAEFVEMLRWADVIAMNVMSSYAALNTELNVRFMRRVAPGRPIILGGHHATFYVDEWLARDVDVVVRREGETTFHELIEALASGSEWRSIDGISFLADGTPQHNPDRPFAEDLDSFPMPRWDLVDFSGYNLFLRRKGSAACLETSRGCAHHCQFCQVGPMWKHTHRWKSADRVVQELADLHGRGVRQLFVVDDDYGDPEDVQRQAAIYDAWEKSGLDFEWGTFMRTDYILRNPEMIERGARLGLCYAFVGFETASPSWLKTYNKGFEEGDDLVAKYQEAYRIMRKNNVMVMGFLVVGYPNQTVEDLLENLKVVDTFCDYPVITAFKPLKGTAGYRYCEKNGLLTKDSFYHDSQAVTVHGTEAIVPAYNRFFMKVLANPKNLLGGLFSSRRLERDMQKAVYAWFGQGLLRVNRDNFSDWLTMKLKRNETPQQFMDRLQAKYINDDHVERLARPFGPGEPPRRDPAVRS